MCVKRYPWTETSTTSKRFLRQRLEQSTTTYYELNQLLAKSTQCPKTNTHICKFKMVTTAPTVRYRNLALCYSTAGYGQDQHIKQVEQCWITTGCLKPSHIDNVHLVRIGWQHSHRHQTDCFRSCGMNTTSDRHKTTTPQRCSDGTSRNRWTHRPTTPDWAYGI